ncbi:MAG: ornithine carbamoyltransferase [Desulfohalobiaceae bacterium]|nr:ornithine carbamoyltransferase [Desulfohalobiaceae bacterium]
MPRHVLSLEDLPAEELSGLLDRGQRIKSHGLILDCLSGGCLVLLFEKASTRTRVSFEVAAREAGGYTLFMTPAESQLGRSEPLKDTARVLSRYAKGLVVRTFSQANLLELVRYADVPVINALSDSFHPCQVLSDLLTISERSPDLGQVTVAWIGDGNNVAQSWINAAAKLPFTLFLACPDGFEPDRDLVNRALGAGANIKLTRDPELAVSVADYVNTDVWASMGQEEEEKERLERFAPFRITSELLDHAPAGARVMHCLPAHRGQEISEEVLEGPASIVWDQAENRLHMQKALLEWVFGQ